MTFPAADRYCRPGVKRLTHRRREAIILGLAKGETTMDAVRQDYGVDASDVALWRRAYSRHGVVGLKAHVLRDLAREDARRVA